MLNILGLKPDISFFRLLEQQADAAVRAAAAFNTLLNDFDNARKHKEEIVTIEREADDIAHQIANKVAGTFVTPLDKEDITALSSALDDITDAIEATAVRITLYRLTTPRADLKPLGEQLAAAAETTKAAVIALSDARERANIHPTLVKIHEIENKSDDLYHDALDDLFNSSGADALTIIKWKEVYDRIEVAVDKCEDVATIVESVVIKYA